MNRFQWVLAMSLLWLSQSVAGDSSPCPKALKTALDLATKRKAKLDPGQLGKIQKTVTDQTELLKVIQTIALTPNKYDPAFLFGILAEWVTLHPLRELPRDLALGLGPKLEGEESIRLLESVNPAQRAKWEAAIRQYLKWASENPRQVWAMKNDIQARLNFARVVAPPQGTKVEWVEVLKRDLSRILEEHVFPGVHTAKIYQFAKSAVYSAMGYEVTPLTDLIVLQKNGLASVVLLGTHPLQNLPPNSLRESVYGVHMATLKEAAVPRDAKTGHVLMDESVEWAVKGQNFSGEVKVKVGLRAEAVAPAVRQLNYDSMWADGALTGAIVLDGNLYNFGPYVLKQYREYLEEQGFRVTRAVHSDSRAFLKDLIESGRLDYLIREGHGVGSTDFVDEFSQRVIVWTGVKSRRGARSGKEEILLISPFSRMNGNPIRNLMLHEWMKNRAALRASPQLLFVDSSCGSLSGLNDLVNAVGSPKFVAVGADESTETFTNEPTHAIYQIIEGVRGEESFGSIRNRIEKAYTRRAHEDGIDRDMVDDESYAFPDESHWRKSVIRGLSRPLIVQVEMRDSTGRVVDLADLRNLGRP